MARTGRYLLLFVALGLVLAWLYEFTSGPLETSGLVWLDGLIGVLVALSVATAAQEEQRARRVVRPLAMSLALVVAWLAGRATFAPRSLLGWTLASAMGAGLVALIEVMSANSRRSTANVPIRSPVVDPQNPEAPEIERRPREIERKIG